jgi:DeoR/GlpR family transcriptional regulator of sugar metabolism
MYKQERLQIIMQHLEEEGRVSVNELGDQFKVSVMTVRRDLRELEDRGWIERTHGGAVLSIRQKYRIEPPTFGRMDSMAEEKRLIAKAASNLVGKDEMFFLGSGTTTLYVARELINREDITIVTNSLPILHELAMNGQMTVIAVGGFLRRKELSLIGHFTDTVLRDLRVNKVIMGIQGIHPKYGLTCDHPQELETDRTIMEISDNVIVVADHTKFGHVASSRTAPVTSVSTIITTEGAPLDLVEDIRAQGVDVMLVNREALGGNGREH